MHTVQEKEKFPSQLQQNPRRVHEIGETNEIFVKVDEVTTRNRIFCDSRGFKNLNLSHFCTFLK